VAKNKEVATGGKKKSREESFGGAPGHIAVAGGDMAMFGHKIHGGVWPDAPTSVDSKTGYPKGFQNSTKSIKK
jgi:hypothetical protein